jgi:hypothetical protein
MSDDSGETKVFTIATSADIDEPPGTDNASLFLPSDSLDGNESSNPEALDSFQTELSSSNMEMAEEELLPHNSIDVSFSGGSGINLEDCANPRGRYYT